jgi:UDP-N-acetyl-D-mannosaminuronic acid dehydrogenase
MLKVAIIGGGGHVGLPLGVVLAGADVKVVAIDNDEKRLEKIRSGLVPFIEPGIGDLLKNCLSNGTFSIEKSISFIKNVDFVIIVIGTSIDEHGNSNAFYLENIIGPCIDLMEPNQVLILRSTIFPGVTRFIEKIIEKKNKTIRVAYCPERIAEGRAVEELSKLPQLVGVRSKEDFQHVSKLFDHIGCESILVTPEEAELAKLFSNSWRYIKFGIANEFWTISNSLGLNYENIRKALSYNYPRALDLPKAGFAAGPCLPKDTMQLNSVSFGKFNFGSTALTVNESLPYHVVEQLASKFKLDTLVIGLLGSAFKPETDDQRSSLTYKLRKILKLVSKEVLITDPFISNDERILPLEYVLEKADLLVICTSHEAYENLQTQKPIINLFSGEIINK